MTPILDIPKSKRKEDYNLIHDKIERTELGIRAISIMYHEHSSDKNSWDNIFWQKENIYYKLSSIRFQYKIFLEQLFQSEHYLLEVYKKDPNYLNGFVLKNPYFDKIETELAAIFDNIIFNSVSIFDYLSHDICYICKANKEKTDYWSTLVKSANGRGNEISRLQIAPLIKLVESSFVKKLNDYRSRLIHRKRDKHKFTAKLKLDPTDLNIKVIVSDELLSKKYLKIIKSEQKEDVRFTLTYVVSWIINRTLFEIERILEGLFFQIKSDSYLIENLRKKKTGNGLISGYPNPITKRLINTSDVMWWKYKEKDITWLFPKK